MTSTLESQLVAARDSVQTFALALTMLDDDDMVRTITGVDYRPRVTVVGGEPPIPWSGDEDIATTVLRALRRTHDASYVLCQLDIVDDPLPFDERPRPGVGHGDAPVSVPALDWCKRHLHHLDVALAEVQAVQDTLVYGDLVHAMHACSLVVNPEVSGQPWRSMARRARYLCDQCGNRLSGRSLLCAVCASRARPCKGTQLYTCDRLVPSEYTRCGACSTRLHRERKR